MFVHNYTHRKDKIIHYVEFPNEIQHSLRNVNRPGTKCTNIYKLQKNGGYFTMNNTNTNFNGVPRQDQYQHVQKTRAFSTHCS